MVRMVVVYCSIWEWSISNNLPLQGIQAIYNFIGPPNNTLHSVSKFVLRHGTSFPMPAALPQVAFFLLSLGIWEGFFHVRRVHSRNKEKNTFLLICMFWGGQCCLISIGGAKKSMIDRTLATPIIYVIQNICEFTDFV